MEQAKITKGKGVATPLYSPATSSSEADFPGLGASAREAALDSLAPGCDVLGEARAIPSLRLSAAGTPDRPAGSTAGDGAGCAAGCTTGRAAGFVADWRALATAAARAVLNLMGTHSWWFVTKPMARWHIAGSLAWYCLQHAWPSPHHWQGPA